MEVNSYKDKVQQEALSTIENDKHHRAKIYMATGTGKSRVPILYIQKYDLTDICLVVPTRELRDLDWPNEFKKWGAEKYLKETTRVTMRSCHKIKNKTFRLLIIDEAHNITPNFFEFLANNTVGAVILLTATEPKRGQKADLIDALKLESKYVVTLQQAREMGLVAPFKLHVVYTQLDNVEKYVPVTNKKKNTTFYVTEKERYDYYCLQYNNVLSGVSRMNLQYLINQRMHLIYNLRSKARVIKQISDYVISPLEKVIVFVGNSVVADFVCPEASYHSNLTEKTKKERLNKFIDGEIMRLSAIKSLNEGKNIPLIDKGIIGQITSEIKDIIQQLGRIIRIREGHKGEMVIVVCKGTQDEVWAKEALSIFPPDDIKYYTLESFLLAHGNKSRNQA